MKNAFWAITLDLYRDILTHAYRQQHTLKSLPIPADLY